MWDSITGPRRVTWDSITGPWESYVGQYNGTMGALCGTV